MVYKQIIWGLYEPKIAHANDLSGVCFGMSMASPVPPLAAWLDAQGGLDSHSLCKLNVCATPFSSNQNRAE